MLSQERLRGIISDYLKDMLWADEEHIAFDKLPSHYSRFFRPTPIVKFSFLLYIFTMDG